MLFSSLFGEMIHFEKYFSNGLKPPTRSVWGLFAKKKTLGFTVEDFNSSRF